MKKEIKTNFIDLAEIIGIMMGDGHFSMHNRRNLYHTVVCFHKKELEYLNYVRNLFLTYFESYKFSIYEIPHEFLLKNTSLLVDIHLLDHGLKSGNKIKNKITIPEWIINNNNYLRRCIRGFFDTDGCVYRKYNNYAQIQIKLGSPKTINSVYLALKKLGYNPTKIQKEYHNKKHKWAWKIYLSRQNEIKYFFNDINPMNPKHIMRYKRIINGSAGI